MIAVVKEAHCAPPSHVLFSARCVEYAGVGDASHIAQDGLSIRIRQHAHLETQCGATVGLTTNTEANHVEPRLLFQARDASASAGVHTAVFG